MNEHALRLARDNLRRAMELRSMTSFDISEKIGRNRTYIDDFIRGRKRSIASSSIRQIAVILNIAEKYVDGDEELPVKIEFNDTFEYWEKFSEYMTKKLIEADTEFDPHIHDLMSKITKNIPNMNSALQVFMSEKASEAQIFYKLPYNETLRAANVVQDEWSIPKHYVENELDTSVEDVKVMPVPDMSMTKAGVTGIFKGDYLIIDTSKTDVRNGGIFAIFIASHVMFRRIELVSQDNLQRVMCKAANPDYASFEIDLEKDVHIVGRAIAHIRRL